MSAVQGMTTDTLRNVILSVGTHRSDRRLSPIEVASAIDASLAAGTTSEQLAQALRFEDTSMLSRFRRLLQLAPNIQHLVEWGSGPSTISLTTASEIARLPSQSAHQEIVKAALEYSLRSGEVRQIVQIIRRSGKPADEAIQTVLRLRPQVETRHLFVGAVVLDPVHEAVSRMDQRQRDELLERALHRHAPDLPQWTGRLGTDRFTLVGDANFAKALTQLPDGFEQAVNHYLEAEVVSL